MLFLLIGWSCLQFTFGQTIPNENIEKDTTVYTVVQEQPDFAGGQMAMAKWSSNFFKSSKLKDFDSICSGSALTKIYFSFVVEKDGRISNKSVKTYMTALSACRQAVEKRLLSILDAMPAWNAGRQDGKPVRVRYNLPVSLGYFWED